MRKKRSMPRNRQSWCSCQPTPLPVRKASRDLRLVDIGRGDHLEGAGDVDRARLGRRAPSPARRHREAPGRRIVVDVAGGRLGGEPFADVALGRAGAPGELRRAWPAALGERLVEAELVADQHERAAERRAHVADHLAHERVERVSSSVSDDVGPMISGVSAAAAASASSRWSLRFMTISLRGPPLDPHYVADQGRKLHATDRRPLRPGEHPVGDERDWSRRSWPKVLIGPWPGTKAVSSPSGQSRPVIASIRSW